MKRTLLFLSLLFCQFIVFGQDPFEQFENLVNPVNGNFHFSQKVVTIRSSSGQGESFNLNYTSDLKNGQPASWVGLGWQLNFGEIHRQMVGFPDEKTSFTQIERKIYQDNIVETDYTHGTGPLEFDNYTTGTDKTMDVILSSTRTGPQAISPAFDQFYVSGAGVNGTFELSSVAVDDPSPTTLGHLVPDLSACLYPKNMEIEYSNSSKTYVATQYPNVNTVAFDEFMFTDDPLGNNYIKYYYHNAISSYDYINDGFLEYYDESGTALDRSLLNTDSDKNIVAFTIYTPKGLKYHYSLPIVETTSKYFLYTLNGNNIDPNDTVVKHQKNSPYVTAWKLTAITGADYEDVNTNGYPDDGDKGYWVKYNYSRWHDKHARTPYAGVTYEPHPSRNELTLGTYDQTKYAGSVTYNSSTNYYLESIETDLEKIVLYKDFRDDEYNFSDLSNSTGDRIPSLALRKIVKFHKNALLTLNSSSSVNGLNNKFESLNTSGNIYNKNKTYFYSDYSGNEGKILNAVEFTSDYDLQKKYDGNINKYPTSPTLTIDESQNNLLSVIALQNFQSNGKLTLNQLQLYGEDDQYIDRFEFNYSNQNPDFKPNDFDQDGYYLDLNNEVSLRNRNLYVNTNTQVDNWLLKQITYPSDVVVNLTYEADRYKKFYSQATAVNTYDYIPLTLVSVDNINRDGAWLSTNPTGIFTVTLTVQVENSNLLNLFFNNTDIDREIILQGLVATKYVNGAINPPSRESNDRDFYLSLYGNLNEVNQNGVGTGSMSITNYNLQTGQITLQVESLHGNSTSLSLWQNGQYANGISYAVPKVRYLYLAYKTNAYSEGSSRVKKLEILPASGSSQAANYTYSYSNPVKSYFNKSTFLNVKEWYQRNLFYGNKNTPYNSNKMGVIYGKTKVLKYGLNGIFHSSAIFEHDVSNPIVLYENTRLQIPDECYVPQTFLNMSPAQVWNLVYEQGWEKEDIPALVWEALQYYIYDILIPQKPTINSINDSASIAFHLSKAPIHSTYGFMHANHPNALLSRYSTISDGNTRVTTINTSSGSPYVIEYFTVKPSDTDIKNNIAILDNQASFGQLLSLEARDKDSNVTARNEYQYADMAYYRAIYYANMESSGSRDIEFVTQYNKAYTYPRRKISLENGLVTVEQIYSFNQKNGKISKMAIHSSDENILKKYEYAVSDNSYKKFWSKSKRAISSQNSRIIEDEDYQQNIGSITPLHYTYTKTAETIERHPNLEDYFDQFYLNAEIANSSVPYEKVIDTKDFSNSLNQRGIVNGVFENTILNPYSDLDYPFASLSSVTNENNYLLAKETTTLIDEKGNILEKYYEKTDTYTSSKFLPTLSVVHTTSENLPYDLYTASSFEDSFGSTGYCEGEVSLAANVVAEGSQSTTKAHTGKYYLSLPASSNLSTLYRDTEMKSFGKGGLFIFQLWVRKTGIQGNPELYVTIAGETGNNTNGNTSSTTPSFKLNQIATFTSSNTQTYGDWALLTVEMNIPEGFYVPINPYTGAGNSTYYGGLTVSVRNTLGVLHADDFRFCPAAAPVSSQVLDLETGRVSAKLSPLHLATKFIYDYKGRNTQVLTETLNGFTTTSITNYND